MADAAEAGAPPEPVVLKAGQVIQGYEIVTALGKGKFSIVYMAKRLSDESMCALKRINIFDMMNPKQREKCLKEVRLLQSLDHPNIVKLLDSIVDRHDLLIIVEWAEKGDLKRLIRKKASNCTSFSEPTIWEYTRQLSAALHHMHSQRIMHRDLKPANVFVTMAGTLKLGDLGLGRFFSSQTLEAFSKVGTPLYMSPEVLHGAGYDMRSDVWSLGCVVYELVMLRSPFKSDQQLSLYDLFVRISKGEYPPLADRCSANLKELVTQMLNVESTKRLDTARVLEVCNAQKQVQAAEPECRPPKQTEPRSRPPPLLVMDDIVEKLKLLNCEELLLLPSGMPLLHRCFFTQQLFPDGDLTQFTVMHKLIHWLLDMIRRRSAVVAPPSAHRRLVKVDAADASAGPRREEPATVRQQPSVPSDAGADVRAGDAAAGGGSVAGGSARRGARGSSRRRHEGRSLKSALSENHEDLATNLMRELKAHGIHVADDTLLQQLQRGWGEDVCLIINELINQELVGRDFHFERPAWRKDDEPECEQINEEEELMEAEYRGPDSAPASEASSESESESSCELQLEVLPVVSGFECSSAPLLEPVHEAPNNVTQEAWLQELERVKPLLRQQLADANQPGWRWSFGKARKLSRDVQTILHCQEPLQDVGNGQRPGRTVRSDGVNCSSSTSSRESRPLRLVQNLQACRARWLDELARISNGEERLQEGRAGTELARLRAAIAEESQRHSVLQGSVSVLSAELSNLIQELESVHCAAGECDGQIQDPNRKLSKLRAALRRLQIEDRQLNLRVGLLQSDLTNTLARGKRGS